MRYLVFATLGALAATVILAVPNRRRLFLAVFIFSLQLDATMFFSYRGGHRSTGWSGPPGIEVPLALIPALVLFLIVAVTCATTQRKWDWGNGVGRAGFVLWAASILSFIPSNESFFTLCAVLRATDLLDLLAVANGVWDEQDVRLVFWLLSLVLLTQSLVYLVENALGMTFQLTGDVLEQSGSMGRHGGTVGVTLELRQLHAPADAVYCVVSSPLTVAVRRRSYRSGDAGHAVDLHTSHLG
jgi:hypothetical protein